jgi:hypothetical protein
MSFNSGILAVPPLSGRRASDTSTVSTWSVQHTPHHVTPVHSYPSATGLAARSQGPVPNSTHADGFTWLEGPSHQQVAPGRQGPFQPVSWDQPLDPIAEWIDSDTMIMPPEEVCDDEVFPGFSLPMGTW